MAPSRRSVLRASGIALGSLLAGCAGDGGDGDERSPTDGRTASATGTGTGTRPPPSTPTSTATPTDTPTATPSPTPLSAQETYLTYQWDRLEGERPEPTDTIVMRNTAFHPLVAAVAPGMEITVTNEDAGAHTFTAPRLGIDERLDGGTSVSVTVDRTGQFDYVCTLHPPAMLGRLLVTPDPPSPTSTATRTGTSTPAPTDTPSPTDTPTETPRTTRSRGRNGRLCRRSSRRRWTHN